MSLPFNHLSYLSQTFVQYKTLLEDWSNYIDKLYEDDLDTSFTPDMESNIFVDFTRLINVDMKTFIIAMAGNFHTRQRVNAIFVWWLSSLFFLLLLFYYCIINFWEATNKSHVVCMYVIRWFAEFWILKHKYYVIFVFF